MEKQQNTKKKRKNSSILKNILKNCCMRMSETSEISVKTDDLSANIESISDPKLWTIERKSAENTSQISFHHHLSYSEPNYCIDPTYDGYSEFKQPSLDVHNQYCNLNEMKKQFVDLSAARFTKHPPENEQSKLIDKNFKNSENNSSIVISDKRISEQPLEKYSNKFFNENIQSVKKFEANNSEARLKEKLLQILYITLKNLLFMNGNSEESAGDDIKYEILKLFKEDINNEVLKANKNITEPSSSNNSLVEYDDSEEDTSKQNTFIFTQNVDYDDIAERNLSTAKDLNMQDRNTDLKPEKKKFIVKKRIAVKPNGTKRIVKKNIVDVSQKSKDKIPEKEKSDLSAIEGHKKTNIKIPEKKTVESSLSASASMAQKQKAKVLEKKTEAVTSSEKTDQKPKTKISNVKQTDSPSSSSSSSSDKSINKQVAFNLNAEPIHNAKVSFPPQSYKLGNNVLTVDIDKTPSIFKVKSTDLSSLKLILKQPGTETDQNFTKIDVFEISPEEALFPEQSIKDIAQLQHPSLEQNAKVILISPEDSENQQYRKKPSITILPSQFDDRKENEIVEKSLASNADKSLIILPMPKKSGISKFKTRPTIVAIPATDKSNHSIKSKDKTVTVIISPSPSQLKQQPILSGSIDKKWSDIIQELNSSLPSSVSEQPIVIVVHEDSEYASKNIPLDDPKGSKTWPIVFVPSIAQLPQQDIINEETTEDFLDTKSLQPTIIIFPSKSEHTLIKIDDEQRESYAISATIPDMAKTYRNFEITADNFSLKSEITYGRSVRTPKTSAHPTCTIQMKKPNINISATEVSPPFGNRVIVEKIRPDSINVKSMFQGQRQHGKCTENSEINIGFRKRHKHNKRITNKTNLLNPGCIIVHKPKQFSYDINKQSKMTTIRYPNNMKFSLKSMSNSKRKSETQQENQNIFFDMNEGMQTSQIAIETFEKETERNLSPQIGIEISQNTDQFSNTKLDLSLMDKKTKAKSIFWSTSIERESKKCRKKTYAQLLQEKMEARRRKEQNDDDDLNTMLDSLIVALHQGEK